MRTPTPAGRSPGSKRLQLTLALGLSAILGGCLEKDASQSGGGEGLGAGGAGGEDGGGASGGAGGGGGPAATPPTVPSEVSAEEFCSVYVDVLVAAISQCERLSSIDPDDARSAFGRFCTQEFEPAFDAGVVAYNAARVADCLRLLGGMCFGEDMTPETRRVCDEGLSGTLIEGRECFSSLECKDGACDRGDGECPGACLDLAGPGESCEARECGDDLFCQDGHCARPLEAGTTCRPWLDECAPSLICLSPDDMEDGVCGAPIATGEGCASGQHCVTGFCTGGACAEKPPPGSAGDECSRNARCGAGLFCLTQADAWETDATGQCLAQTALGQACRVGGGDFSWFWRGCGDGGLCKATPGDAAGLCILTAPGDACLEAAMERDNRAWSTRSCSKGQRCEAGQCLDRDEPGLDACLRP